MYIRIHTCTYTYIHTYHMHATVHMHVYITQAMTERAYVNSGTSRLGIQLQGRPMT